MRIRPAISAVEIVHTGTDDRPIVAALTALLDAGRKEGQDRLAQLNSAGSEHVVVPAQNPRGACLTTSRDVVSASGMPGPATTGITTSSVLGSASAGPGNIINPTLVTKEGG